MMRSELKDLIKLQDIDATIAKLAVTKSDLLARISQADEEAAAAQEFLENRQAESTSFRSALDSREVDLKVVEGKIAKFQGQLNRIKTNKEYTALQHEILGEKANKSRIEDEILAMMVQIETDRTEIEALRTADEEAKRAAEEEKAAVQEGLQDADARAERLQGERAELVAQVPGEYLTPYERLRKRGGGRAMAACRNFVCDACRMSLTANTVNLLMAGDKLIFCHSCGRILYIAQDEDIHGGIGAGRRE